MCVSPMHSPLTRSGVQGYGFQIVHMDYIDCLEAIEHMELAFAGWDSPPCTWVGTGDI